MAATTEGWAMNKKYFVRLTAAERATVDQIVRKLKGSSEKVRRGQKPPTDNADQPWVQGVYGHNLRRRMGFRMGGVVQGRVVDEVVEGEGDHSPGDKHSAPPSRLRVRTGEYGVCVSLLRTAGGLAERLDPGATHEGRFGSGGGGVAAGTLRPGPEGDPWVRQLEHAHQRGVLRGVSAGRGASA